MTIQATPPSTLADAVCRAAERFQGTAVKFRRGQQWVSHSWNEYGEKIMNLALGLASKGISKG
ncbi:MAG: hypothetical protein N2578_03080, partial [Bdellovibrionaceae bacterium]|nr:hypothetical protein [Pseudobdellovibrionaceae bacterium]